MSDQLAMLPEGAGTPAPSPADAVRTATFAIEIDRSEPAHGARAETIADGRLPVVFSSQYAVERTDWWDGERYLEVLDHSADAIDMQRASRGLPFLDSHELRAQLGRVEDITLRGDGKLVGYLRFSQRREAQDYRQDILDGIRGEVSVGYRIEPDRVEVRRGANGGLPTYLVRRWAPIEVSGVSVPADPTVGVFRSANIPAGAVPRPAALPAALPAETPVTHPSQAAPLVATTRAVQDPIATVDAPSGQELAMSVEQTGLAPNGASVTVTRQDGESPEVDTRRRSIAALAQQHAVEDVFARGMAEGKDLDAVQRDMMSALQDRMKSGPKFEARVQLTEREEREYSLARAILLADSGKNGFEREVSEDIAKRLPQGYQPKGTGLFVPTNLKMRTAIETATTSLGGAAVFSAYAGWIDYLRNATQVVRAGARVLPGLSAPVSFVKQNGTGTAYWVDEVPGSDTTESNMTFALVTLSPKTLQATQAFSRQLLIEARSVMNAEMKVREDLTRLHAVAIDAAAIAGTGTLQPLGLTKSTAVGTVTMGAAGAVPTYDALVDLEVKVRENNVVGPLAYLTTPGIAGKLKKTQVFATTNGVPVWTGQLVDGTLNGAPAYATNQVPANLTKGTSTTICHAIIAGAFQHMLIGEFGAAEIITDPFAKKKQGLIEVTSFQMVDIALEWDTAFATILDAKVS